MNEPPRLIILTGDIGIGKSTLCAALVKQAQEAGLDVAGILSPALLTDGRKAGIEALDPRSGERRLLARYQSPDPAWALRLGLWSFDESVFAWANNLFRSATPCDLLVVDELGHLELALGQGWIAAIDAVASRAYRQALVVIRSTLLPHLPAGWPPAVVFDASTEAGRRQLRARLLTEAGHLDAPND
jgi:nucleoside-triphosphatase THEP1